MTKGINLRIESNTKVQCIARGESFECVWECGAVATRAGAMVDAPSSSGKLATVTQAWQLYVAHASLMLRSAPQSLSCAPVVNSEFESSVRALCEQGLAHFVVSYFLDALEVICMQTC